MDVTAREQAQPSLLRDMVMLTKPRIISLLLVTTIAPMFVAGNPGWLLVLVVFGRRIPHGGRRKRGQHVHRPRHRRRGWRARDFVRFRADEWSREVGARVRCRCSRPPRRFCLRVSRTSSPRRSRSAGFYFYVFIYTRWLKRTTPQNIVIGGAAGAFPPLVGWAAMTGTHRPDRGLSLSDHLLLDAAAFLGARPSQAEGLRRARACRWRRSCGVSARRCVRCSGTL